MTFFVVNRDPAEPVEVSTDLRAFGEASVAVAVLLGDEDLTAANTQDAPDRVAPREHPHAVVRDGVLEAHLPPASWSMVVLDVG